MKTNNGSEFSQDWYFQPAEASEVGEMEEKLDAVAISGDFATDARSFLMAIGQGSKALDGGDLETARAELQSLLSGEHTVEHLQVNPSDRHLAEADQAAMKRVLEEVLKSK